MCGESMFYYIIHHIVHQRYTDNWKESRKNILTFILGSLCYIFLWAYLTSLKYEAFIERNFVLTTFRDWYILFVLLDICAMAIVYKQYWSRSILHEFREVVHGNDVPERKGSGPIPGEDSQQ